ncbi:MAG: aminotransferase class IV [Simkania sp.]|nr:aminotransferase class IV [Simkania sp.]
MSPMPFAYFKGKVVPLKDATLSIASHSLQYGSTCYAGLRGHVREGVVRIFRLKDHHARLMRSMQIMGWDFKISYEDFKCALQDLIHQNQPTGDFYIRPFVFSDTEMLQLNYRKLEFHLGIYMVPFGPLFDPERGLKMKISPWKKIADDAIPTKAKAGGCYLNSALATTDAIQSGYDEALMTNREGHIVEASAANLLLRYRDKIIVPPLEGVLDGITLRSVLELLEEEGIEVQVQSIDRSMVLSCDELLLTGTAAQITHVESVEGRLISEKRGPLCKHLQERMERILNRQDPKSEEWVTDFQIGARNVNHIEEKCLV